MITGFFLNINKPKGITSFDVIFKLRRLLNIKKIGHAGTLDPLAQGVLPVAVGEYTKLIEYLPSDKKYEAEIKFGENSTTYDAEGKKTFVETPDFSREALENAIQTFVGEIDQRPPMYSAIKIKGKKLYELARKGETVEVPSRRVKIYGIKLLDFNLPFCKLEVSCSSGTYIRSLAYDLGTKLGTGAYLKDLTRTLVGKFEIENAQGLDENLKKITPLEVLPFKTYELDKDEFDKIKNGVSVEAKIEGNEILCLIYNKKVVSISKLSGKMITVEKNLKG